MPSSGLNPFTTFDKFLAEEAKATEAKTTKEVMKRKQQGMIIKIPKT